MTGAAQLEVTDSQVHLFPAAAAEAARQFGHRVISADELIAEMDAAQVHRAILIPPRVEAATNELALDAAGRWPDRLAVVGKVVADRRSWGPLIDNWRSSALLGLRISFPRPADGPADPAVAALWQSAGAAGIPVMVWAPGRLGELREVAQRYPGLRIAVDHCGLGPADRGRKAELVIPELRSLAECPNVSVKVSALPGHSTGGYPFTDLHHFVAQVNWHFGPGRVFWGSDLSGLGCSYSEAVSMFTDKLAFLGRDNLKRIMHKSISEWLGW